MTVVHLVRHGRPAIRTGVAPELWALDPAALADLHGLRESGALPESAHWVSSPERKALSTARTLTDEPVEVDDDLREAYRPAEWLSADEFERRVLASFADPDRAVAPGWEPLIGTGTRVWSAADRALSQGGPSDVVLVGHGTSFTLLVADLLGQPPDLAAWRAMRFPDHCAIDVAVRRVLSPWGAWAD